MEKTHVKMPRIVAFAVGALFSMLLHAQVTDLRASKSGSDVDLTFSGTTAPWRVVRSQSPRFDYGNALIDEANVSGACIDAVAINLPNTFFYDTSSTPDGEPPADQDQPTESVVVLTSLGPNYGWENQSITINGSGFAAEPTDNLVFFGPLPAIVTAGTLTTLTVTVPQGVTTGPVTVQKGPLASNSLTFYAAFASGVSGTPFENISSIAFNDVTADPTSGKHLFISDMGTNGVTSDYLWEVMDDYSLTQRPYWNEQKGLPMDVAGNLYFANTTSASNAGIIKKYDAVTHVLSTYTNGKLSGETNSVSIVGIALQSDGIVFLANRTDNTIRRRDPIATGATIYASGKPLDLYMGMAMDSGQTLYFTSGGSLYKTPTSGLANVSLVASGFANASGIDIDETTGNKLLLLADRGAGKVYLINADTGLKDEVATGLTSPRAVAFGEDKVTGELYYYVAEATRVLRLPDPRIKLDARIAGGNKKVLISKRGTGDTYPLAPLQTADAQIKIPFEVQGKISSATTVYIRLIDPKDTAPYATGGANDNRDPNKNGGAGASTFQNCLSATSVTVQPSDPHGEVTLTITNQYAGDNYQVGFSFKPTFLTDPAEKPAAITGILTAWKRVYIERDKMFRRGGLLYKNAQVGETAITLYKNPDDTPWCTLNPGEKIAVFDTKTPFEKPHDEAYIGTINDTGPTVPHQALVTLVTTSGGSTAYQLTHTYTASPVNGTTNWPTFSSPVYPEGTCAGVGVKDSGFCEEDLSDLKQAFDDAFVEFILTNTGMNVVPFISRLAPLNESGIPADNMRADFHELWSQMVHQDLINYFHFIGAAGHLYQAPPGVNLLGATKSGMNSTFIFRQLIEGIYSGTTLTNGVRAVSDHEMAHQFRTNNCDTASNNHDTRQAWCASSSCSDEPCLNQAGDGSNFNDSINKMCVQDLLAGDPSCNPLNPTIGSVRNNRDPE